jgi:hypothetical protein
MLERSKFRPEVVQRARVQPIAIFTEQGRWVTYDVEAVKRQISRERIAREKGKPMPRIAREK